jgi:hypothetical protein
MKDSKDSTEQKRWEEALRCHQYYTNQITRIKRLVRTNSSFAVLWQQRLVDRKEKLEKEFPTLKDSKMTLTHFKDITDKNATYDTVITNAGTVLVAKLDPDHDGCVNCVFDAGGVVDDLGCTDMPRCNSARTDNRAIIWVVKPDEPSKFGSSELQQLVNLTKESMAKNPVKKPYEPQPKKGPNIGTREFTDKDWGYDPVRDFPYLADGTVAPIQNKKPAQKTYDPQEIKVRLNTMLHQVASLNQTTNSLDILARQIKTATDLLNRNDAGVSPWSAFLDENHRKEVLLSTVQANVDNKKLSDAEFRQFVSNSLKD